MRLAECPVCGKSFVPAYKHIYRAKVGKVYKVFCGWNCQIKFEKEREANKQARKKRKEEVKQNAGR